MDKHFEMKNMAYWKAKNGDSIEAPTKVIGAIIGEVRRGIGRHQDKQDEKSKAIADSFSHIRGVR